MLAMDAAADPMVPLFRVMFDDVFTSPDEPTGVMEGYERRLAQFAPRSHPSVWSSGSPVTGGSRSAVHSTYRYRTCRFHTRTQRLTSSPAEARGVAGRQP